MSEVKDKKKSSLKDAAKRLHEYILLHHANDGLHSSSISNFYSADPSAAARIRKRGLMKLLNDFDNLFRIGDDNATIYAIRTNEEAIQSDRNRIQKISLLFYNQRLKGKNLVMKRCEDRSQLTLELNSWKDHHRLNHKGAKFDLRGVSPSAVIRALRQMKMISIVDSNEGVIIWNEQESTSKTGRSRANRIQEVVERVKETRKDLEQNRKGIFVDVIDFELGQEKVAKPQQEISQYVSISNKSKRAVNVTIQAEIAVRRGFVVDYHSPNTAKKVTIVPGSKFILQVSFRPRNIGFVRTMIPFDVECASDPPYILPFSIVRFISIRCGDPDDFEILKPKAPYERKKYLPNQVFRNAQPVEKKRRAIQNQAFARPLDNYKIPASVTQAIRENNIEDILSSIIYTDKTPPEELPSDLSSQLNRKNYYNFFKTLLFVEEQQMHIDIRTYDMEGVAMDRRGRNYTLEVPGLAESRPSVLRGDKIYISYNKGDKTFAADVQSIENEKVVLVINKAFDRIYVDGMKFDVRFSFSRTGLRICHQAVASIRKNKLMEKVLFPSINSTLEPPIGMPTRMNYKNRNLNKEQKAAVLGILEAAARPAPYVLFGPPGTGKTVTMVEAIIQTARQDPSCKILICAPSNAATDLIVERLVPDSFKKSELIRLVAFSRDKDTVPEAILPYTSFDDIDNSFVTPPPDEIKKFKVVVVTLTMGGKLPNIGVTNHFTHIFMDEAGHAIEPLALSSCAEVGRVANGGKPVLVLAGDPKQLGPIIRSQVAKDFGLGKSFLERLSENKYYQRSDNRREHYDSRVITKLVRNYRSHPSILKIPNERFYDNDLVASADQFTINSLTSWEHLPKRGFPCIFHGVEGKDEREGKSPSWFNPEEITIVKEYVNLLVNGTRSNRVKSEEIAVITPYQRQAQKIRMLLRSHNYGDIKVGSVDEFQGSERRVIIISTVRSSVEYMQFDERYQLGFLSNEKRFNVAITRAKALLIVIGNPHVLEQDEDWNSFISHVYNGGGYTGCRFKPGKKQHEDFDNEIEKATRGIVKTPLNSTENANEVSHTTAVEGPAWRSEE